MTLEGTNTWVLRAPGEEGCVVVDPGDDDPEHLERVAGHGPVALVLLTHRHHDHAAGARRFAGLTGAPVRALDPSLVLGSEALGEGDVVAAAGCELRVLATPGHTSDSLSFLLTGPGAGPAVLTGDTVLGRGTTVIAHPDGALGPYLGSLRRLTELADGTTVLPGHGPELPDAPAAARHYLAHREERLEQVRHGAGGAGPGRDAAAGRRARLRRRRRGAVGRGGAVGAGAAGVPARLIAPRLRAARVRVPASHSSRTSREQRRPRQAAGQEGRRRCRTAPPATRSIDCPAATPSVIAVITQPNASVAVPAGVATSSASDCAVTCGVITVPATSITIVSPTSELPAAAIAATSTPNAPSSTGRRRCSGARPRTQRVEQPREHRDHRPRRDQDPAQDPRAGLGGDRRHPDLDPADDQPEPEPGQRDRQHAGQRQHADHAARTAAHDRPRGAHGRGEREAGGADDRGHRRHDQAEAGPRRGGQQRRQRRAEDEEDLHADRLVVVGDGRAARPGGTSRLHSARDEPGSAGWTAPATAAAPTTRASGAPRSTAAISAAAAPANSTAAASSGRVGPSRSTSRPCTTDPSATPTSEPADTSPATANEPVAPWT